MTSAAPGEVTTTVDVIPREPLGADTAVASPGPARGRLRRLWFVPAGVALLGAAALVPSVGGGGPGAGEARVLVDGVAVVTEADGDTRTIRDDRVDVGPGDEIAVTEGRAVFEMADDVRLEALGRHDGRPGTTVEMAVAPRLVAGRLLAVAPAPIESEPGAATVAVEPAGSADGAARLDRRTGLGVATYRGQVAVETAGRQADVARYRRLEVAAPGALGREGLPLRYEADDAWDRRFLGEALEVDAQVGPLLASLGEARRASFLDPATLRAAMPELPGAGLADRLGALDDGGAALVLAAIATAAEDTASGWDRAADLRADGAPWGLATVDQGLRSADVLPILRAALDTLDLQAPEVGASTGADGSEAPAGGSASDAAGLAPDTAAGAGDGAAPADAAAGGGGAGPDVDAGGDGGGAGSTPPSGPTPGGPSVPGVPTTPAVPNLPSAPEVVEGVGGVVGGTVDGVTDGVDQIVPGAGGLVDDVVGGVAGGVAGLGGAVNGVGAAVPGPLGAIVEGVGDTVGGLGVGLRSALRDPEDVVDVAPDVVEEVPGVVETVPEALPTVAEVVEAVPEVLEATAALVPAALDVVAPVVEAVPAAVALVPTVVESLPRVPANLPAAVADVVPAVVEAVPALVESLGGPPTRAEVMSPT